MQNKNPSVSIIMSTYNRADNFLPKAIESVIKQSYTDWELLVVDDCSTDNTKDIVLSYQEKDPRIRYLCLDKHEGCDPKPKNLGIMESKGEFIAFLDDDVEFRTDHLASLHLTLEKNPGLSFVYCDRWVVPTPEMMKPIEEGGEGLKPSVGTYSDFDPFLLMQKNYIDTSDVMVRKEDLIEVGGFDESIRKFIDWNLWVRLSKTGKLFMRIAQILTNYNLHDKMKTVVNKEGQFNPQTGLFTPTFNPVDCKIHSGCIGKPKEPKIAVFTLLFNRIEYTKRFLQSVLDTVKTPIEKWVFVDQGSNDGTVDYMIEFCKTNNIPLDFKKGEGDVILPTSYIGDTKLNITPFKGITIILNIENTGIAYGSNQALDAIEPRTVDYIMKTDNDCLYLTSGWLEAMIDIYSRNEMMCLSPYIEGLVGMPGAMPRMAYGTIGDEYLGMVSHLGGICTISPATIYHNWRWPQGAFMQGGNDVLFSSYVQKLNYQLAFMENHRIEHMNGTIQQEKDYPKYYADKELLRRTRYIPKQ